MKLQKVNTKRTSHAIGVLFPSDVTEPNSEATPAQVRHGSKHAGHSTRLKIIRGETRKIPD